MNKNTAIIAIVLALVVGIGIGVSTKGYGYRDRDRDRSGMHMMPDGSMMGNDEGVMNMSEMMASMNNELKGKTGSEFDKAFLTEMIVHHEGAVEMAKLALINSEHQEVKNLANEIITAQNKEIGDMKSWLAKWFTVKTN